MLQAYGTERPTLAALGPDDLALTQGDLRIGLEPVARFTGNFADDQLVLRPTSPPGRGLWALEVRGEPLTQWRGSAHEQVAWTFGAVDPEPPTWSGRPEIASTERAHFGCGPAVSVVVSVPTRDTTWIEATVRSGEDTTTVRLPIADRKITLGHGMCSGLIELEQDAAASATLVPIAADGARGKPWGPLEFTAP